MFSLLLKREVCRRFCLENATFSNKLNFFSRFQILIFLPETTQNDHNRLLYKFENDQKYFGCVGSCGYASASVKYRHAPERKPNGHNLRFVRKEHKAKHCWIYEFFTCERKRATACRGPPCRRRGLIPRPRRWGCHIFASIGHPGQCSHSTLPFCSSVRHIFRILACWLARLFFSIPFWKLKIIIKVCNTWVK